MSKTILGYGASHLSSMIGASKNEQLLATLGLVPSFLSFMDYKPILDLSKGRFNVHPAFESDFRNRISALSPHAVFCSISGGDHVVLSMVNDNRRPFDFIVPESEIELSQLHKSLLLNEMRSGEVLPYQLVASAMRSRVGGLSSFLTWTSETTSLPIFVIPAPPPIADEDFLRKHPGGLKGPIEEDGISPLSIRFKFWWLQTSLQREMAETARAIFVPPPVQALDDNGCLKPEFYGRDPVHANSEYGELIFAQIADALTSPAKIGQHHASI